METAPSWTQRYATRLAVTDLLVVAWAVAGAHVVRFGGSTATVTTQYESGRANYVWVSLLLVLAWVVSLTVHATRDPKVVGIGPEEYKRVLVASLRLFGVIAILAFLFKLDLARGYLAIAFPVGAVALVLSRWLWRQWLALHRRQGGWSSRVLVAGGGQHVQHLVRELGRFPSAGYHVVGVCVPGGGSVGATLDGTRIPVVGSLTQVPQAAAACAADTVAVTVAEALGPSTLRRLGWELEGTGIDIVVAPGLTDVAGPRVHTRPVAGLPLLHVESPRFEGPHRVAKRAFDLAVASAGLIVLSPVLLVVALLVRLTSPGPMLYRQSRIGLGGDPFRMLKFRSMVADADTRRPDLNQGAGPLFKLRDDPRVTPVGRRLRRYSLDELPQLWNVLIGQMSLVGPRPPLPAEVEAYEDDARRRLLVTPGITGLWQVSGRSDLSWEDTVRLDLYYVENWSLTADLVILWRTFKAVLGRAGAY